MKKKFLAAALAAVLAVGATGVPHTATTAAAEDIAAEEAKTWEYTVDGTGNATITKYNGDEVDVSIPDLVGENITVTALGSNVFGIEHIGIIDSNYTVKTLNIPNTVTDIANDALIDLHALETITVSEGSTSYSAKDGVLYNSDKTELVKFPSAKARRLYNSRYSKNFRRTLVFQFLPIDRYNHTRKRN